MDFIFMLTRQDRTVANGLAVLRDIAPLRLRHIGFKDIGVDLATLHTLNAAIQASGATSYLEVVATSPEAALRSAEIGVEIGVNRLLGGTQVTETLRILAGTNIEYYPFPGTPIGHPTQLGGTADLIETQTAKFISLGCAGVDLLAYRATETEPLALVHAARRGLGQHGRLICAGGIDSPSRIAALATASCNAFTIGSAAFDQTFSVTATNLPGQLQAILACL